jgi:large conductance mechanosensitive channel
MGFVKEFKEFAMRGNVVDMAVGIVIGAAFGKIVSSFVADMFMPPLGLLTSGVDLGERKVLLRAGNPDANVPDVTLNWGTFLSTTIDFVLVAFAIFLLIKGMNAMKRKEPAPAPAPAAPPRQEVLLEEIRDLLRKRA